MSYFGSFFDAPTGKNDPYLPVDNFMVNDSLPIIKLPIIKI